MPLIQLVLEGSGKLLLLAFCVTLLSSSIANAIIKDFSQSPIQTSDPVLTEALKLVNEGKPQAALESVEAYINNNPNSAIAYEIRGVAYSKIGNLNKGKSSRIKRSFFIIYTLFVEFF